LIQGSLVAAQELDANLSPTSKQYTYQINSNLGTFNPTSVFSSQYIGLNATGHYYDEVVNAISGGTITLNGYSDLASASVLNVNLLTTLAYQRIQHLVASGMNCTAARTQAESEVLAVFHIPPGSYGLRDARYQQRLEWRPNTCCDFERLRIWQLIRKSGRPDRKLSERSWS
jgi:hypothetical protein